MFHTRCAVVPLIEKLGKNHTSFLPFARVWILPCAVSPQLLQSLKAVRALARSGYQNEKPLPRLNAENLPLAIKASDCFLCTACASSTSARFAPLPRPASSCCCSHSLAACSYWKLYPVFVVPDRACGGRRWRLSRSPRGTASA